ncbi:dentin sialophosphoprotein-like [Hibiscus syriacus]|uniref:dentin sialophosphoprotein-like n=1 Tax=Hibiscus syriacus TaxID=106335 RepID=UPI001920F22A|nr:dentin sialophosphoprotein-like [Hibiscus syriacus]
MDDEQTLENKTSVDYERDDKNDTSTADMSNTDDSGEMGYSEKLNFDRNSSDDSMEEDLPETKQSDSQCSTDEIQEDSVENESLIIKELESHVVENKSHSSIPAEKRKLQDEEAMENNEPPKRHKWNSNAFTPTDKPKDTTQLAAFQSNSSSSDSKDNEDTTKEQDVSICGRSNRDM